MKNSMIKKMQNTKVGKMLRRLVGEDAGAVMMEYVILAVLIAAAAVVAIAYFGKTIVGQANSAATATSGKGNAAADISEKIQKQQSTYQDEAVSASKKFSDSKEDAEKVGK